MKLSFRIKHCFKTLSPTDYLLNQRTSQLARASETETLRPLPGANHGEDTSTDEIKLIGVPHTPLKYMDGFKVRSFDEEQNLGTDLICLQIDPSLYIARQRFVAHKFALGKVEDYHLDGVDLIDPHRPITFE